MDPRSIAAVSALAALALALAASGCADECSSNGDCLGTEQCSDGTCVPAPRPPPPKPYDGGTEADDTGVPAADGGMVGGDDGGDAGVGDGGALGDAGVGAGDGGTGVTDGGGIVPAPANVLALIEAVELDGGRADRFNRLQGLFFEHAAMAGVTTFAGAQGPCHLIDWQALRPTAVGMRGTGMIASGFQNVFTPNGRFFLTQMSPGVFDAPPGRRVPTLWSSDFTVTYEVEASTAVQQLTTATATLASISRQFAGVSPAPGSVLTLDGSPIELRWTSTGGPLVIAELGRPDRSLLLRCEAPDAGILVIPGAAVAAYQTLVPQGTSSLLEAGYELSRPFSIPRRASTSVSATLRHVRGVRYETR